MKIHKLVYGEVAPCGVDYSDVKIVKKGIIAKAVQSSRLWRKVSCARCLKARKK